MALGTYFNKIGTSIAYETKRAVKVNMKINIIVLLIITVTFIVSCQKSNQNKNAGAEATDTSNPNKETQNTDIFNGPSDGGGGDTCNGKMIESFKVDITSKEEFKDLVLPLFEKLTIKTTKEKQTPFLLTPQNKSWYIIECKLNEIPKNRKGLYLESYQTAIQTGREIFIERDSYDKMTKEEKAKLILHESIMGFYLMKYQTLEELCKLSDSCTGEYSKVSKWKMFKPEKYSPLNEEDHQKIRNVTAWIWNEKENLTSENFAKLLQKNDFDKRFSYSPDNNDSKEVEIEISSFIRMLKKYQWSQQFPEFCKFDKSTGISQTKCKTELIVDSVTTKDFPFYETSNPEKSNNTEVKAKYTTIKQLNIQIKITRESDQKVFLGNFMHPLLGTNPKIKLYVNKLGNIVNAAPFVLLSNWPTNAKKEDVTEGFKSQALFFMLNLTDIENPKIYNMYFQNYVWYSFEEVLTNKDGLKIKEIYGYPEFLEAESEILFDENELVFNLDSAFKSRQFIRLEQIPN